MYIFIHKFVQGGVDDFASLGLNAYAEEEFSGAELQGVMLTCNEMLPYEDAGDIDRTQVGGILIQAHHTDYLSESDLSSCCGVFVHCDQDSLEDRIREVFNGKPKVLLNEILSKSVSFSVGGLARDRVAFIERIREYASAEEEVPYTSIMEALKELHDEHSKRLVTRQSHAWLALYLKVQLSICDESVASNMRENTKAELLAFFAYQEDKGFTDPEGRKLLQGWESTATAKEFAKLLSSGPEDRDSLRNCADDLLKAIQESQKASRGSSKINREGAAK